MNNRLHGILKYGKYIDPEVIELCDAINKFKKIKTWVSCCGHGKDPFVIGCHSDTEIDSLPLQHIIQKYSNWSIINKGYDFQNLYTFAIQGPVGAYGESNKIAEFIMKFLESEEGKKYAR